jgi:thiol-disulfide isomerase/thioredoxin
MKSWLLTLKAILLLCVLIFNAQVNAQEDSVKTYQDKIKQYQGKVIYLDFWASWCGPCRRSFPWMNQIQKKYKAQGLQVISINLDSDRLLATEFLDEYPVNFDVIYDPKGVLAKKYKLKGMPQSFIINQSGELVSSHIGFTAKKQAQYEQELIHVMEEK